MTITEDNFKTCKDMMPVEELVKYGNRSHKQCPEMPSLFRTVKTSGEVKYRDMNRVICVEDGYNIYLHWGHKIVDELFPITMPYTPEENIYKVTVKRYNVNNKWNEFNVITIYDCITPDGTVVPVNRYYKIDYSINKWVQITEEEFKSIV